jgi:hypothetical protein
MVRANATDSYAASAKTSRTKATGMKTARMKAAEPTAGFSLVRYSQGQH